MVGQATDDGNPDGGAAEQPKGRGSDQDPVFEMIVLGSGGGPLETDCSGYIIVFTSRGAFESDTDA